jgi:hypothetical protein
MRGANLRRVYESNGANHTLNLLEEAMSSGKMKPEQFDIKELAFAFLGEQWFDRWDPDRRQRGGLVPLLEAGDAVDVTAFSNIIGQLIFSKIMSSYKDVGLVADSLCSTVPTKFKTEKIPGISNIIGNVEQIPDGMPFPELSMQEDYLQTPETAKHGAILSVTKETIFFDRTGELLRKAGAIGKRLGIDRERRIIDVVIGVVNPYTRLGTNYNTYQTSGALWTNQISNPLIDWTNFDVALQTFALLVDPYNNEPIMITPNTVLVYPPKLFTSSRVLGATEVRHTTESGNLVQLSPSPMAGMATKIVSSAIAYQREIAGYGSSNAGFTWYYGDFKEAFNYMENWGMEIQQAAPNMEASFERDIVLRYRCSERGVPNVNEPRAVLRNTATS